MESKKKSISNAEIKRGLVNQLEIDLLGFRDACLQIPVESVDPKLRTAIHELGIDVIHFIDQYRMTDKSIPDINKLQGATINFEEREFFREMVMAYQIHSPGKFPTWQEFSSKLDGFNIARVQFKMPELNIESRTYDKWKEWWKVGQFDHLVHD